MDLKKLLFDNWGIKLISLGLSLALWFYVTSTGKTEMTLIVPLELQNIRPGMTVVGDVAGALEIRVQGQERVLRDSAIGKKVVAVIDLSMSREGENTVRISPDDIKHPAGMTVTHLSLPEIKVKLERLMRRSFRLTPILRGAPASGYRLIETNVTPTRIMVEGAASVMKTLKKLETMPIDIQGARETINIEPKIDYQRQSIKLLEKKITVRIGIERMR